MSRKLQGVQIGAAAVVFAGAFGATGLGFGQTNEQDGTAGVYPTTPNAAELRLASAWRDLPLDSSDEECSHDHDHDHDHSHSHDDC